MLFLRREGKWDEVSYADMFFTLRNHTEWQKECGINLAPQDQNQDKIKQDPQEIKNGQMWIPTGITSNPREDKT